jgi:hypothetical protein
MQDTVYLVVTYWKRVYNCLGTSQDSILNVYPSEDFGILSSSGGRLLRRGGWIQRMLSNEELSIAPRRKINIDRDQKGAAIDQKAAEIDCLTACDIKKQMLINIAL